MYNTVVYKPNIIYVTTMPYIYKHEKRSVTAL